LSERILGVIRVFTLDFRNLIKHLYFTTDRVIVVKITKVGGKPYNLLNLSYLQKMKDKERELAGLSAEELLKQNLSFRLNKQKVVSTSVNSRT